MKKMFVNVLSLLLVTVAFTGLVGCQNNADSGPAIDLALVGTWVDDVVSQGTTIILKADGTGSLDSTPLTWTATNGVLKLFHTNGITQVEYPYAVFNNRILIILNADGDPFAFTKL